jgi:hypothetical protein
MRCKALGSRLYQIWTCAWLCLAGSLFQVSPSRFTLHTKKLVLDFVGVIATWHPCSLAPGLNIWALYTPVLGGSHFLWEPARSGSYILLWEFGRFSLSHTHTHIYRAGENWAVLRIFIFSKFTWFSNRPVLAYMITVSSPVLLSGSHNPVLFFSKLIFNLIVI